MLNFIINMTELSRNQLHVKNTALLRIWKYCFPQQRRGAQGLYDQSRGAVCVYGFWNLFQSRDAQDHCDQGRGARVWKITDTTCKAAALRARVAALIRIFVILLFN